MTGATLRRTIRLSFDSILLRTRLRPIGAILIALAAICLQRAATLPWAASTDSRGARTEVSPFGVARRSSGGGDETPTTCRWWPKRGAAELCAMAPEGAVNYRRLRMAYPLLATAMWVAVIGLFLQVLRLPRQPIARSAVTWGSTALTVSALIVMSLALPDALASIAENSLRWSGAGFIFACSASVLSFVSGFLALAPDPDRPAAAAG